jgi:DNA (cytosine-5)-methyltransferase 1
LNLSLISLFSGIGGLDYGFEKAGFETLIAVDSDKVCREVIKRNRQWKVVEVESSKGTLTADLSQMSSRDILRAVGLRKKELDVLIGGPPCQPFSKAGYWARGDSRRLKDPRAGTLHDFLRIIRDTLPKVFLVENVPGFAFFRKNHGLNLLIREIKAINTTFGTNYRTAVQVINAADYGVPQIRHRLFIVGCRDGHEFIFPAKTHCEPGIVQPNKLKPYVTAWEAFADLPKPSMTEELKVGGKWGALLPSIPEGYNYLWHTSRGGGKAIFGWRTRYWSFLLKLAKNKPAWTIPAEPGTATGPFHWRNRRLSIPEMSRLQTLPRSLVLDMGYRDAQRLIGNAVPSLLAEVLASQIREQIFEQRFQNGKKYFQVSSKPIPKPEPVMQVPRKYLRLVGSYADHPGPGLGPLYADND